MDALAFRGTERILIAQGGMLIAYSFSQALHFIFESSIFKHGRRKIIRGTAPFNLLMERRRHNQKILSSALILCVSISAAPSTAAAGSMLRITCEGDDVGAEVSINGKFKGECPADVQVNEGTVKLLVRKKVDEQRERVFESELRIGDGVVKKIEAQLGVAQLNATEKARQESAKLRLKKMPFDVLQKEATSGDIPSMLELASRYFVGRDGTTKDEKLYNSWTRKAAEAGDVYSMYVIALNYSIGKDRTNALLWYQKAAALGHAPSMLNLGMEYEVYEVGDRLVEDKVTAAQWFRKAADAGDTGGISEIGMAYMTGSGVPKSWEQGVAWFRKGVTPAAYANNPRASYRCMYWLGKAYEKGWSVPQDEQQAIAWWRKAAEGEYADLSAVKELQKRGLR